MNSHDSIRTPIPNGMIARNVAPIGEAPDWQHVPKPADWDLTTEQHLARNNLIFGHTWAQIQARQQRKATR